MNDEVMFLLGSKISDLPDVGAITRILFEQRWPSEDCKRLIPRLLVFFRDYIAERRSAKKASVNYEEIGALLWETFNPTLGVRPWIDQLDREFGNDLELLDAELADLIGETLAAMQKTIAEELRKHTEAIALKSFFRAFLPRDRAFSVATTNHDLLIETSLAAAGHHPNLGFKTSEAGDHFFDPDTLRGSASPKVLKLHGSIDWFNRPEEKGRHPATVVRSGRLDWALHEFLVGGANKLLDYNFSIDLHLFHEFQSRLQHANRIVVAGYGFGDPGINVRLLDWVEGNQANRLLVIHPNPEKLRATVEAEWPQLQHAKSLFGATNQTSFVPCRFEQATEPEFLKPIREHLADGDPAGH